MQDILDKKKEPLFVCIGTKGSFYDNTSNRIGKRLLNEGFDVILECDTSNMKRKLKQIKAYNKDKYQVIAIDLSYNSEYDQKAKLTHSYSKGGIIPGGALGRKYEPIGDVSVKIYLQAVEDIKNKVDLLMALCKTSGNTSIYQTEDKIFNELKDFYV